MLSSFRFLFTPLSFVIDLSARTKGSRGELRYLAGSPAGARDIRVLSYPYYSQYSMIKQLTSCSSQALRYHRRHQAVSEAGHEACLPPEYQAGFRVGSDKVFKCLQALQ